MHEKERRDKNNWSKTDFYHFKWFTHTKIRTWCAADIKAGSNTENAAAAAAAAAAPDEYWWVVDVADDMFVALIAGKLT